MKSKRFDDSFYPEDKIGDELMGSENLRNGNEKRRMNK